MRHIWNNFSMNKHSWVYNFFKSYTVICEFWFSHSTTVILHGKFNFYSKDNSSQLFHICLLLKWKLSSIITPSWSLSELQHSKIKFIIFKIPPRSWMVEKPHFYYFYYFFVIHDLPREGTKERRDKALCSEEWDMSVRVLLPWFLLFQTAPHVVVSWLLWS